MKAVIFDLDGTILNTLLDLKNSVNYVLKLRGYPERTYEEIRNFVGNGVKLLMKRALPNDVSETEFNTCFKMFTEHYENNLDVETKPYSGIMEILETLKNNNIPMGIVSNKFQEAVTSLNNKYFQNYIKVAIGNRDNLKTKPHPDSVYLAMQELNLSKDDEIYFVGDSDVDILTAHNAGLPVISVTWGFRTRDELIPNNPDYLIDEPSEILNILKIK